MSSIFIALNRFWLNSMMSAAPTGCVAAEVVASLAAGSVASCARAAVAVTISRLTTIQRAAIRFMDQPFLSPARKVGASIFCIGLQPAAG